MAQHLQSKGAPRTIREALQSKGLVAGQDFNLPKRIGKGDSGIAREMRHNRAAEQRLQLHTNRESRIANPEPSFHYAELMGFSLRLPTADVAAFVNSDHPAGILIERAEARWHGLWIPFSEALRLDEESEPDEDQIYGLPEGFDASDYPDYMEVA